MGLRFFWVGLTLANGCWFGAWEEGGGEVLEGGGDRRAAGSGQREEWARAFRWYLQWCGLVHHCVAAGAGLVERVCGAVQNVGLRRGLSLATRRAYLSWVRRYAAVMGSAKRMMKVEEARRWLEDLKENRLVSYSTHKQAVNALQFLFRDVCGRSDADLRAPARRRGRRRKVPEVLASGEVFELIERVESACKRKVVLKGRAGWSSAELSSEELSSEELSGEELSGEEVVVTGDGKLCSKLLLPGELDDGSKGVDMPVVLVSLLEPLRERGKRWHVARVQGAKRFNPGVLVDVGVEEVFNDNSSACGSFAVLYC